MWRGGFGVPILAGLGGARVWCVPHCAATVAELRSLIAVNQPLMLCMICAGAWLGLILQPGQAEACPGVLRDGAGAARGLQRSRRSVLGTAGARQLNGPALGQG